jgi:hypothetical protein
MPLEADEQVDMLITIVNEWSDSVIQVKLQSCYRRSCSVNEKKHWTAVRGKLPDSTKVFKGSFGELDNCVKFRIGKFAGKLEPVLA